MNKYYFKGIFLYIYGNLQDKAGKGLRNRNWQAAGFAKQISGKSNMAIGYAQKIMQHCARRQNASCNIQA